VDHLSRETASGRRAYLLVRAPHRSSQCSFAVVIGRCRGRGTHCLSGAATDQSGEGMQLRGAPYLTFRTPPGAIWYLPRHQTRHPGTISKSSDASLAADPPAADSLLRCQSGCYEAGAFGGRHGQSVDSGGCRLYRFLSCAETAGECRRPGQARYRPGDRYTVPLCTAFHANQHRIGELSFWSALHQSSQRVVAAVDCIGR